MCWGSAADHVTAAGSDWLPSPSLQAGDSDDGRHQRDTAAAPEADGAAGLQHRVPSGSAAKPSLPLRPRGAAPPGESFKLCGELMV